MVPESYPVDRDVEVPVRVISVTRVVGASVTEMVTLPKVRTVLDGMNELMRIG